MQAKETVLYEEINCSQKKIQWKKKELVMTISGSQQAELPISTGVFVATFLTLQGLKGNQPASI